MDDSRIKNISSLLTAFFDHETVRQGKRYADVFGGWRQIAGERLAAHSKIVEIERDFLIVEAEHPGWIQLLQLRQSELLASVQRRFPELSLRGIAFRLGHEGGKGSPVFERAPEAEDESGEAGPPSQGRLPDAQASGDAATARESLGDKLPDGEFKDSLERLKAAVDERARTGRR
ncbi:MAG TPA: DUF721 domain-containing protein [Rectinemataceae bacterium]|nr:DUF721 domain-containing protein [Rectinemataceae bacterium]